jgi:outer membrane protein assembly factor BamB
MDGSLTPRTPLRLWPGVAAAIALVVLRFVLPAVIPDAILIGLLGGLVCAVIILVWWLFFSRAPWLERLGAILVMVASLLVARQIVDVSIRGGMMGMMLPVFSVFILPPVLVLWAVVTRGRSDIVRRAAMVVMLFGAVASFGLLRTNGVWGGGADLEWRWTPTAEERLLAAPEEKMTPPPAPTAPTVADAVPSVTPVPSAPSVPSVASASPSSSADARWPGFRGPDRDSVIRGVTINTDWTTSPPVEVWRRAIGPGWSSFAVVGDRIYTQEQRGEDEIVACYNLNTGAPIWRHRDPVRFWESNAGAGPRGTPTVSNGRVYAFGATGLVNALDAATGARIWSHNAAADTSTEVPMWGFSSSPLVIDDVVIVTTAGTLVAYGAGNGQLRWKGPARGGGYSSPHRVTIDGVVQVVQLSGAGATSVAPADGTVLWTHDWEGGIVQPAVTSDDHILITNAGMTGGQGMRKLAVARGASGWTVEERWTSNGLKPYFNDYVVHKGHAYGFDGNILAAIDLADGKRKWKGGRYGEGQLVLLADQDLLLVLSEEGDVALVNAAPDQYKEVARFTAIEGKTWNHPVVVGNLLLVRNGEEMAAFRLK